MAEFFETCLEILPPPQWRLWNELDAVPAVFTLYGDTALALYLAQRASVDFDFFGEKTFDPDQLLADLPFLSSRRAASEKHPHAHLPYRVRRRQRPRLVL